MKELNGQIPEGAEPMRHIIHQHTRSLLQVVGTDVKTLPDGPTISERMIAVTRGKNIAFTQPLATGEASRNKNSRPYMSWIQTQLRDLGLTRFTLDWESTWKHPYNQLMDLLFYRTLDMALRSGEYNHCLWNPEHNTHKICSSMLEIYFNHLQTQKKRIEKHGEETINVQRAQQRAIKFRERVRPHSISINIS